MTEETKKMLFDCNIFDKIGLVLVILKLIGVISWSWWWVTAPFWVPIVFLLIVFIIVKKNGGCP